MSDGFKFNVGEKVVGESDSGRRELIERRKNFEELKNYWRKMPEDFLAKREDREVYDIEEDGVAVGAEVEVLRIFKNFLVENFVSQGIWLGNVDKERFRSLAGGEKILGHLRAAGYDFDKLMRYWRGTFNKYRGAWFNAVFGETQMFIDDIKDENVRKDFEQALRGLIARMKMTYRAPIQSVENEDAKRVVREERELLIDATDDFLQKMIEYCQGEIN